MHDGKVLPQPESNPFSDAGENRSHCVLLFGKVHAYTLLSPHALVTSHPSTGPLFHLSDLSKATAVSNFEHGGLAEALNCALSLK